MSSLSLLIKGERRKVIEGKEKDKFQVIPFSISEKSHLEQEGKTKSDGQSEIANAELSSCTGGFWWARARCGGGISAVSRRVGNDDDGS